MQINNNINRTSFGEKYPLEKILYLSSDKKLMPTSDVINTVKSLNHLTIKERDNLLRNRSLLAKCVERTKEKILSTNRKLAEWVEKINQAPEGKISGIVEDAKQQIGKEIDVDIVEEKAKRYQYA